MRAHLALLVGKLAAALGAERVLFVAESGFVDCFAVLGFQQAVFKFFKLCRKAQRKPADRLLAAVCKRQYELRGIHLPDHVEALDRVEWVIGIVLHCKGNPAAAFFGRRALQAADAMQRFPVEGKIDV